MSPSDAMCERCRAAVSTFSRSRLGRFVRCRRRHQRSERRGKDGQDQSAIYHVVEVLSENGRRDEEKVKKGEGASSRRWKVE